MLDFNYKPKIEAITVDTNFRNSGADHRDATPLTDLKSLPSQSQAAADITRNVKTLQSNNTSGNTFKKHADSLKNFKSNQERQYNHNKSTFRKQDALDTSQTQNTNSHKTLMESHKVLRRTIQLSQEWPKKDTTTSKVAEAVSDLAAVTNNNKNIDPS